MMCRILLALFFVSLALTSPTTMLAREEATPDPGYGGVPTCDEANSDPGPADCVPDPGKNPGDIIHSVTVVAEVSDCAMGTVETSSVVEFERHYVAADNEWHPTGRIEKREEVKTRPMDEAELAECESTSSVIDKPATPPVTAEPVEALATEIPVTEVSVTEEPAGFAQTPVSTAEEPEATDDRFVVTMLPRTGTGAAAALLQATTAVGLAAAALGLLAIFSWRRRA